MSNYGLYISDGVIPIINDDSPLLIIGGDVNSTVQAQTGSVFLQKSTHPSLNTQYGPLVVTECNSGYVRSVANTNGSYYIQSESNSSILSRVLTTSKYNLLPKEPYGLESYNAIGELVFSSYQTYPKIASIAPFSTSSITNMVINSARGSFSPVYINHAYASNPLYSLDSINQTYFYYKSWYTSTQVGWNYSSVGYIMNIGLKQISNTQCALATIANYYNVSQAIGNPSAGYAAGLYVINVVNSFGTDALVKVLDAPTPSSDEVMYRFVRNYSALDLLFVVEK